MFARGFAGIMGVVSLALFLQSAASHAQEKVYRHVSTDKLESLLKEMNLAYKKTADKQAGTFFYDYERNNFKIRLHNYNGRDLWIDAYFSDKLTLEEINGWNVRAKFSRAVLMKSSDRSNISLEAQLDCLGGVTEGMLRQFINRFDGELVSFVKYLTK